MEMTQMMAHLLGEIKANKAKMDANLKEMREEMRAGHKELMAIVETN
jgi:hypothetical protein